jgi:hypothetical protein
MVLTSLAVLLSLKQKATGFFRVEKYKWTLVDCFDPLGGRFIHRGIASVNTIQTDGAKTELEKIFKN